MRTRLEPPASNELAEATSYLTDQSSQAAESFLSEMVVAMRLLSRFPRIGSPLDGDVRRLMLRTFPYQLIYRVLGDEIRIYAVAHLKRRPDYWTGRLPR